MCVCVCVCVCVCACMCVWMFECVCVCVCVFSPSGAAGYDHSSRGAGLEDIPSQRGEYPVNKP